MSVLEVINVLTPVLEACMYFFLFEAFLIRRYEQFKYSIFGIIILAVMIQFSNNLFRFSFGNILGLFASSVVASLIFYKAKLSHIIMVSIVNLLISTSTELLVTNIIGNIFHVTTEMIARSIDYRVLGVIVSKMLGLMTCNLIRLKMKSKTIRMTLNYWILFCVLFFISLATIFLLFRYSFELQKTTYNLWSLLCSIGLICSIFFALFLYERLARQSEAIRQQEQYEQQLKTELRHLDDILIKQEELKKVHHDMKNQLLVIKSYFEQGNAESGVGYVNTLVDAINETKPEVYSGNVALDAIINTKKILAENKGIEFTIDVMQAADLPMDDVDVCVVFGNALDNAIEACERCKNEKRFINFFLIQKGQKLVCKISNTTPIESTSIEQSSKKDKENHGYGLVNIKESLAKYDSEPVIEQKDGVFCLGFVIYE